VEQPRRPLCFLLARAEGQFVAEFDARLAAAGYPDLSHAHTANVLRFLRAGKLRPGQLVELACVTKQAISQQVAYLERCGYVTVSPDPHDSRARQVQLTAKGDAAQRVASQLFAQIEQDWAHQIGAEQLGALRTLLESALVHLTDGSRPTRGPTPRSTFTSTTTAARQ